MNFTQTAIDAAHKAGNILLDLCAHDVKYSMKNSHDILAEADLASEKTILDHITTAFPDHSIFSEEKGSDQHNSPYLWIIDPLDGTQNFSRGIDEFCISIALQKNEETILGLIYQPTKNVLFIAEKGNGATCNDKPIHVSKIADTINATLTTDSTATLPLRQQNYDILSQLNQEFRTIRLFGSAALHMAKIAAGHTDVYYKTKYNHWDYVAGSLLVAEAGGMITDFENNPITKDSKDIVVSNGLLHENVITFMH